MVFRGWRHVHSQDQTGVWDAITDGSYQSHGGTDSLGSQGCGFFYLNKADALKALRWDMTRAVMDKLAALDWLIEEEVHAPSV